MFVSWTEQRIIGAKNMPLIVLILFRFLSDQHPDEKPFEVTLTLGQLVP